MPDVVQCITSIAEYEDGTLKSHGYMATVFNSLALTFYLRHEQDGLPFRLLKGTFKEIMAPLLKRFDKTFSEWIQESSRQIMPMSVGTLLLADTIKCIRSPKAQMLRVHFEKITYNFLNMKVNRGAFSSNFDEFLAKPRNSRVYKARVEFVLSLREIDPSLTDFPFKSGQEFNDACAEIEGACAIILSAVTGIRCSELHSIKADWFEAIEYLDVNGEWTADAIFKSKINKTSGGVIAKRGLSPLGIEVFELLNGLSWIDKVKEGLNLFSPTYKGNFSKTKVISAKRANYNKATIKQRVTDYYKAFVERSHESVQRAYPKLLPHDLRHYKMAFGLRKFDGDVEEMISQEFRHHKYFHTPVYAKDKLNDEEMAYRKREYVQEIVRRILINDPNDSWVGPSADKVRELAKTLLNGQNIELLSLEELAVFHEQLHETVHTMKFHSYGLCFVLNDTKRNAKCGVKDNIVRTGDANSESCYQCANFCANNKSHYSELDLNLRRWKSTSEDPILSKYPIAKTSQQIVKNLTSLIRDMENSNG
ncbi:hypothetical protein [Neptuniibacter sp. QD48_11]|uniref:hypothetical protein n=1 Tax=Neptuniibacter sp. QD48_11 TaxID=3398211 RepID=UPI0039F61272